MAAPLSVTYAQCVIHEQAAGHILPFPLPYPRDVPGQDKIPLSGNRLVCPGLQPTPSDQEQHHRFILAGNLPLPLLRHLPSGTQHQKKQIPTLFLRQVPLLPYFQCPAKGRSRDEQIGCKIHLLDVQQPLIVPEQHIQLIYQG